MIFDNRHPTTGWPNSSNGFALVSNSSGTIHVYTGGGNLISADYAIQNQANQWHHIAVSRQDSFTSLFINGVRKGDIIEDLNDYNEGRFTLGSSSPNGEGVNGYFNDLRIYKGVAKYKPEQLEIQASKPSDIQVLAPLLTGSVQTYLATTRSGWWNCR